MRRLSRSICDQDEAFRAGARGVAWPAVRERWRLVWKVCTYYLLLIAASSHAWGAAKIARPGAPVQDGVRSTILSDLGSELRVRRMDLRKAAAGSYYVDLEVDVQGYPEATRREIRGLVREIVAQSLLGLGYELDPDSRFRFTEGPSEIAEVRGQPPITVVMFMPNSTVPRTIRLSPSAVRAMMLDDIEPASAEVAAALGVPEDSTEILVNTRQIYLRWRNLEKTAPKSGLTGAPSVVYARWWGEPPPPFAPPPDIVERESLLEPWWARAGVWSADMDALVSAGAASAAKGSAGAGGEAVPELVLGAGRFSLGYQRFSHSATLTGPFAFAGIADFPAGSTLQLDLDRLRISGRHTFVRHNRNHLDAILGLELYNPSIVVDSPLRRATLDGFSVGPVAGVAGSIRLSKYFDLGGAILVPLAVLGKSQVTGVELDGGVRYRFPGGFIGHDATAGLGYRLLDIQIERGDTGSPSAGLVEPQYQGFYVDLQASW